MTETRRAVQLLREAMGRYTQQELAGVMNVCVRAVARWEDKNNPKISQFVLHQLLTLARTHGAPESTAIFEQALRECGRRKRGANLSQLPHTPEEGLLVKQFLEQHRRGPILTPETPISCDDFLHADGY